ncbi:MAG UNVERIFIED_CONTAM: hypothetical protein LVR18_44085 [Planctomycetaceae bacterium]
MASQATLFSDWSEPTPPTFVPSGYRYYPEKVESRPRADAACSHGDVLRA